MKLSEYLSKREMTDAAFAEKAGLSQSQVNRLRRGVSRPNWKTVQLIAAKTGNRVKAADWADAPEMEQAS